MKVKTRRISTSLVVGSLFFAILLSACLGVIGFSTYRAGVLARYQIYLETAMNFVVQNANGDDLDLCIEDKVKSEAYEELQIKLDSFKEASALEYLYIIKPLHTQEVDNVEYILTAIRKSEIGDEEVSLGKLSGDEYSAQVVADFLRYLKTNEIAYYANYTEFGYMYSAVVPILDSKGNPVALAAADISMDEVYATMAQYIIIVLLSSLVVTALFLFVQIGWLKRRIVRPIGGLAAAAKGYVQNGKDNHTALEMHLPNINTKDELELLCNAMERMSIDMNEYMRNLTTVTAEKERIGVDCQHLFRQLF